MEKKYTNHDRKESSIYIEMNFYEKKGHINMRSNVINNS